MTENQPTVKEVGEGKPDDGGLVTATLLMLLTTGTGLVALFSASHFVLCEINVSCVSPFPESAITALIRELKRRLALAPGRLLACFGAKHRKCNHLEGSWCPRSMPDDRVYF
jgi:hypothetical protein